MSQQRSERDELVFCVRLDCVDRAFRLANTAIDAFIRVDDEHVLALVEAVDGTYLHAVHVLTFDTAFIDDVGHHLLRVVGTPQTVRGAHV
jgi:hypothetical protein